jgi:hypothetical protein
MVSVYTRSQPALLQKSHLCILCIYAAHFRLEDRYHDGYCICDTFRLEDQCPNEYMWHILG